MGTVKFEVSEWKTALDKVLFAMKNKNELLRKAFLIIGPKDIKDHFAKESGPEGKWADWSPAYKAIRQGISEKLASSKRKKSLKKSGKKLGAGLILQLTGNLRKASALNPQIRDIGIGAIEVTSNIEYSGVHNEGSKKKNIPKREFMYLSESAQNVMRKVILEAVGKGLD